MSLSPGVRLGPYEILSPLGAGGMGEVWRAKDPRLGRDVAVKVLPEDFLEGEERKQRFEREARLLAALNHPGIAAIYSFEEIPGSSSPSSSARHLLTMELVEGETLARRLASGPLPLEESLSLSRQIAEALSAAHAKGIVHRDLKPGNVMVSKEGRVKLLDFGLAKRTEALPADDVTSAPTASKHTAVGVVMGTAGYMSPEQARGLPVDERTDVWAFGCVLYEMLAGRKAFTGATGQDILAAILTKDPDLNALRAPVSSKVKELLARCLKRDPDERLSKIADAIPVLEGALSDAGRSGGRVPWLALGAAAAAVVLLAAGGIWLSRRKPAPPAAPSAASVSPSIAVLPFANLSADKEQEYFSDGLTEEVMGLLTRIKDLKVTGRTSSFAFKGKSEDLKAIGKTLNVATVLEGSVRRSGDRLRVAARLVNASDGYQVWSETYDRKMADVFAVQDEIAGAVVAALKVKLLPGESVRRAGKHTPGPGAHERHLLARKLVERGELSEAKRARDILKKVIESDREYAEAFVTLGVAEWIIADASETPGEIEEGRRRSFAALEKGIALDPGSAYGYARRGWFKLGLWDWAAAESDLDRAIVLDPGGSEPRFLKVGLLVATGRRSSAAEECRRVLEIDPLHPGAWVILGDDLAARGQLAEARKALEKVVELAPDPEHTSIRFGLGMIDILEGKPSVALAEFERISQGPFRGMGVAIAQHALGRESDARRALDSVIAGWSVNSAYQIAMIYGRFGERDKAFEWLDRAYAQRDAGFQMFAADWFFFGSLRSDPRYAALLKKLKLPVSN